MISNHGGFFFGSMDMNESTFAGIYLELSIGLDMNCFFYIWFLLFFLGMMCTPGASSRGPFTAGLLQFFYRIFSKI